MKRLAYLVLPLLFGLATLLPAAPVTWTDGSSSARFDDTSQADAVCTLRPRLSQARAIGLFVDVAGFDGSLKNPVWPCGINSRLGSDASPVPASVHGHLSCFEGNIATAQGTGGQDPSESGHAFGATIRSTGTGIFNILDGAREINGQPASTALINLDLKNNAGGGYQVGAQMQSDGRFPGFAAYSCGGPNNKWLVAMDASRLPIYNTSEVVFADPPGAAPWTIWADNNRLVIQVGGQVVGWWGVDGTLHVKKLIQGQ